MHVLCVFFYSYCSDKAYVEVYGTNIVFVQPNVLVTALTHVHESIFVFVVDKETLKKVTGKKVPVNSPV